LELDREILADDRLLELRALCPECGLPMSPRGRMFRMVGTSRWHVAFGSDCKPGEEFGLWQPGFEATIQAVLADQPDQ
jgi:hypothetical protein